MFEFNNGLPTTNVSVYYDIAAKLKWIAAYNCKSLN